MKKEAAIKALRSHASGQESPVSKLILSDIHNSLVASGAKPPFKVVRLAQEDPVEIGDANEELIETTDIDLGKEYGGVTLNSQSGEIEINEQIFQGVDRATVNYAENGITAPMLEPYIDFAGQITGTITFNPDSTFSFAPDVPAEPPQFPIESMSGNYERRVMPGAEYSESGSESGVSISY